MTDNKHDDLILTMIVSSNAYSQSCLMLNRQKKGMNDSGSPKFDIIWQFVAPLALPRGMTTL